MSQSTQPKPTTQNDKLPKFWQLKNNLLNSKKIESIRDYCSSDKSLRIRTHNRDYDEYYNTTDQCQATYAKLTAMLQASKVVVEKCDCGNYHGEKK